MSLNSEESKGASSGRSEQAPRLLAGGYATWKPLMSVYLQRTGAEGVHLKATTVESWRKMDAAVTAWSDEAANSALELLGLGGPAVKEEGAAAQNAHQDEAKEHEAVPSDAVKASRKLVAAIVERS